MADSVVGFVVQRLSQLLESEIKLLSGVEEKIKSLSNELKFMDIFIKSSEGKYKDAVVKEVVTQIRDVAHKAEDVVDTYILNIAKHKRRNKLCRLFHLKEKLVVPHEVDAEIEKIKSRIDEIYKNQERYGIKEGEFQREEAVSTEWRRKRRTDVEEEDVVGLVNESDIVIQQLQKDDVRLNVASIVGMGGLGKTTLARKIYNTDNVKRIFPCRAWGNVSNDYRPKELFQSILRSLNLPGFENLSEEGLKEEVAKGLKEKKYLIVLDDIWETRVWDDIKGAFPDDNKGSRVLITSREMSVASDNNNVFPSKLTKITFRNILNWSFMKTLGQLPNLQILKLENSYVFRLEDELHNLDIDKGEFNELQVFHLNGLGVKSWRLKEGAMPRLRHLRIIKCPILFRLPQQLWSLRTLQLVHIEAPSQQLAGSLQIVEFKNNCKIKLENENLLSLEKAYRFDAS